MAKGADLNAYQTNQETQVIDMSKRVKIGIIGTGWIAEVHVKALKECPDVDIVALADIVPGKAQKFAETWGIEGARYYDSDVALLEGEKDLDCVTICTYNTQHAPCAIHALEAGVHVLLEKPFTVTLDEAIEVMRAEKKSGKILSIGFQPRFSDNIQLIKKIVQSGELGDIYYIQTGGGRRRGIPTPFGTSFIEKETGGIGALGDIGCYSLDMVLNAIGYPKPLTATGFKSDFFGKNPDYYEDLCAYFQETATGNLSRAAMETLTIIAYNQPVTRAGIEMVRGVNSDGILAKLAERGLIEERGKADSPGRPILYGTTDLFLKSIGISNLSELPDITLAEQDDISQEILQDEEQ